MGGITVNRGYYYCPDCRAGHVPYDAALGVIETHLTTGACEVICIAGVNDSFATASETMLVTMCGLRVSESTVERTTEEQGEALGTLLSDKQMIGAAEPWKWERDAHGHTVAYLSADATGVRQQGLRGAKAEGKMAYVGMVYNARGASETKERKPPRIERNRRYLAGFYTLDDLGLQLRRQAAQVGIDEVEQQVALSDGGNGLEEFFRKNFPRAEIILDFWHAKEYLVELEQVLFGAGTAEGKAWLTEQCHRLKHEGGAAVFATLQQWDVAERSATVQEQWRVTLNYFQNHHHKMDYPRYVANGWQIGSGQVESACNTVINKRLAGSGRRWGSPGSDALCHLRALYLSEPSQWQCYFHPQSA